MHGSHLKANLVTLRSIRGDQRGREILSRARLTEGDAALTRVDGGEVTSADCRAYLDAVRAVVGDSGYLFARASLIMANCPTALAVEDKRAPQAVGRG